MCMDSCTRATAKVTASDGGETITLPNASPVEALRVPHPTTDRQGHQRHQATGQRLGGRAVIVAEDVPRLGQHVRQDSTVASSSRAGATGSARSRKGSRSSIHRLNLGLVPTLSRRSGDQPSTVEESSDDTTISSAWYRRWIAPLESVRACATSHGGAPANCAEPKRGIISRPDRNGTLI